MTYTCEVCPLTIHPHHARVSFENGGRMFHFHADCYYAAARAAGRDMPDATWPIEETRTARNVRRCIDDAEIVIGSY